jgi:dipeptidyl aminopeptidase/acylaminoacyl peptidase
MILSTSPEPLRRVLAILTLAVLLAAAAGPAAAAESGEAEPAPRTLGVATLLQLDPVALPLPAFHDAEQRGVTLKELLDQRSLDAVTLRPREGDTVALPGGDDLRWQRRDTPRKLGPRDGRALETWLAFYLRSERWQEASLVVPAPAEALLQVWLDGKAVSLESGQAEEGAGERTASLKLEIGTRLVVIRAVAPPGLEESWALQPRLELAADAPEGTLTVTTASERPADIHLILDAPRVSEVAISPDGALVAVQLGEYDARGERRNWLEIRRVEDGSLLSTWRGSEAGGLQWSPEGRRLAFTLREDDTTALWLLDLETGATTPLLEGVADMGRYRWAPDGTFVVYEVRVEAEKDDRKVKRVSSPADRQGWWRDRSYLVAAAVPSGLTRRLTAGPLSPGSWSISPDSERLLFFLEDQDLAGGRPYFSSELWELDLRSLEAEQVLADRWIGGADYGPDAGTLLLQGSPSAFGGLGRTLPEGVQANDYGGQLYLYDRKRGEATPLSRELRPDVAASWWSLDDGLVYALCTDTQFRNVYRCDPGTAAWERVDTGLEFTRQFDLAREGRMAVACGSGATTPWRVYTVDLEQNAARLLLNPGAEVWDDVRFGEVTYWQAPLPDGEQLDGRIMWPVDYDPELRYPVIVYYYGGTSPVTVDFGGRYPKNVWTGQGYIVYVPQPSGATGYGQEYAARHVNDWGKRTAWEVIEATRAFLAAHPAADPERVGCIGASYGGFLTEFIITRTDLYAAAVSHAGISSISSYWGEGLWGYVYGARALADAFPWSDRELYVEQSALFHADEITTPLLLVHGDSDTNVPVGESDQLFTALKLLGREVEYVQIQGQDHHILDHDQRIVWNDTILAFFARYLKGRADWWEALYPEE